MSLFRDWQNLKKDFGICIVLIQCGIFFQTYDIDAELISDIFGLRTYEQSGTIVAGFPSSLLEEKKSQLEAFGYKVVIIEEIGAGEKGKQRGISYSTEHPKLVEPSTRPTFEVAASGPKKKKGKTEALLEVIKSLKSEYGVDVVIAKSGYMFNAFQEDSVKLNEKLGLKIFNRFGYPTVGFPVDSQQLYFTKLKKSGLSFASLIDGEVSVYGLNESLETDSEEINHEALARNAVEKVAPQDLDLRNQALRLAKFGFYVLPLAPGTKKPLISNWQKLATTNPLQINSWWDQNPKANIGIACEVSNLVVVDLDIAKNSQPPPEWNTAGIESGEDVFRLICAKFAEDYPIDTYTVKTPSGGKHLYFHDGGSPIRQGVEVNGWWKVDIRSRGGFIVAAGSESVSDDGQITRYKSLTHLERLAQLPSWLRGELAPGDTRKVQKSEGAAHLYSYSHSALSISTDFAEQILNERCQLVAGLPEGKRNSELLRHSCYLGIMISRKRLDEGRVRARLLEAALSSGLGNAESLETINRGIRFGMSRP